jgi:ABC-type polysaccharide/polyol phosphate export permease
MGVLMVVYGCHLSLTVLVVPVLLLVQIVFTLGVGLILATINVFFRDVQHVVGLLMQLWMFATPIAYSVSAVPAEYRTAYLILNPMAPIIDSYRKVIVAGEMPDLGYLGIAAAVSVLCLLCGYALFKTLEFRFAEVV